MEALDNYFNHVLKDNLKYPENFKLQIIGNKIILIPDQKSILLDYVKKHPAFKINLINQLTTHVTNMLRNFDDRIDEIYLSTKDGNIIINVVKYISTYFDSVPSELNFIIGSYVKDKDLVKLPGNVIFYENQYIFSRKYPQVYSMVNSNIQKLEYHKIYWDTLLNEFKHNPDKIKYLHVTRSELVELYNTKNFNIINNIVTLSYLSKSIIFLNLFHDLLDFVFLSDLKISTLDSMKSIYQEIHILSIYDYFNFGNVVLKYRGLPSLSTILIESGLHPILSGDSIISIIKDNTNNGYKVFKTLLDIGVPYEETGPYLKDINKDYAPVAFIDIQSSIFRYNYGKNFINDILFFNGGSRYELIVKYKDLMKDELSGDSGLPKEFIEMVVNLGISGGYLPTITRTDIINVDAYKFDIFFRTIFNHPNLFKWIQSNDWRYEYGTIPGQELSNLVRIDRMVDEILADGFILFRSDIKDYIITNKLNALDIPRGKFVIMAIKLRDLDLLIWLQSNAYRYDWMNRDLSHKILEDNLGNLDLDFLQFMKQDGFPFTEYQKSKLFYVPDQNYEDVFDEYNEDYEMVNDDMIEDEFEYDE
jgi:hypothetical protein